MLGFTELNSSNQIALEKKFDALLKADDQKAEPVESAVGNGHQNLPPAAPAGNADAVTAVNAATFLTGPVAPGVHHQPVLDRSCY